MKNLLRNINFKNTFLNYLSVKHILSPCPTSLLKALDHCNPDLQVRINSFDEGKQGLIDHAVYEKISKSQYLALKRAGKTPEAIPSMCALVVKNDKDRKPLCAKSHIVVLGHFEDRLYQNSHRYAPVIKYSFLCLLTTKSVRRKVMLRQGYCKNTF